MINVKSILNKKYLSREDIISILSVSSEDEMELVRKTAFETLIKNCSEKVFFRGIVEFSNICEMNCFYCGIRNGNPETKRYILSRQEILSAAKFCADSGYGSIVLQSGERKDDEFIDFTEGIIRDIKTQTKSSILAHGLRITLCIGEQEKESYKRFYDAGAERYLLRIETSNRGLFRKIHPENQSFKKRLECLKTIKDTGFQTGTGVMIGIPGQTIEMLADDILFFRDMEIDMIGMGPYLIHNNTPMAHYINGVESNKNLTFRSSLLMIAAARIVLKNVNIAATTALQAMKPDGRETGLDFGANVIMPVVTPVRYRKNYLLYDGKPCLEEDAEDCSSCLTNRIKSIGRTVAFNEYGDSPHYKKKETIKPCPAR